jgi:hypothetical protein
LITLALASTFSFAQDKNPKALIEKMVETIGGTERLYQLKDVQYTYTYARNPEAKDVSIERYIFDGEYSWAEYSELGAGMLPMEGKVVQGFNGKESWMTVDGKLVEEAQPAKLADFLRKTNYYWFAMFFKLLDPGINYAYKGTRTYEGIPYDLVEITFGENVGDAQDIYLLYVNPYTHLVDQFLFTVMDFGLKDPLMMKVDYMPVDGLLLPTSRRYAPATWEGEIREENWILEISEDIKFNNGFEKSAFNKPTN